MPRQRSSCPSAAAGESASSRVIPADAFDGEFDAVSEGSFGHCFRRGYSREMEEHLVQRHVELRQPHASPLSTPAAACSRILTVPEQQFLRGEGVRAGASIGSIRAPETLCHPRIPGHPLAQIWCDESELLSPLPAREPRCAAGSASSCLCKTIKRTSRVWLSVVRRENLAALLSPSASKQAIARCDRCADLKPASQPS